MSPDSDRFGNEKKENRPDNPFKPMSLTPMKLRNNPAREIPSHEVRATNLPIISYDDHATPASPVTEVRYSFAPLGEVRPDLNAERSADFALREIPVSPVQMKALRERRIIARDLGWSISGHRIRTGE